MRATLVGATALLLLATTLPLLPAASADDGCTAYVLENWWIVYANCGTIYGFCVDLVVATLCTKDVSTEIGIGCGPETDCVEEQA